MVNPRKQAYFLEEGIMAEDDHASKIERERIIRIFNAAADVRKLEITLFWQRSLFFWGFIAAAFVSYAALKDDVAGLRFPVACFGIVCSLAWTLENRGSKYWQEAWEQKVEGIEIKALGDDLFSRIEPVLPGAIIWRARRYSVTRLAIALSDFTTLIWVILAAAALSIRNIRDCDWLTLSVIAITASYVVSMLIGARSRIHEKATSEIAN